MIQLDNFSFTSFEEIKELPTDTLKQLIADCNKKLSHMTTIDPTTIQVLAVATEEYNKR